MNRLRSLGHTPAAAALVPSAASAPAAVDVYLSLEDAPRAVFPEADSIERRDVSADDGLRRRMRRLIGRTKPSVWEPFYISYTARKGGEVLGYAVICEEIGKHRPITFIVAVNTAGEVTEVAIMMYREPIGGEVRYPGFTKQFAGKDLRDLIRHRGDIGNITGATLSARSMSRGVRKALAFLQLTYLDSSPRVARAE
ncbi:MAG: FMN-binding protein [bacterium]|nr:FMN-binding protein [bacterium]